MENSQDKLMVQIMELFDLQDQNHLMVMKGMNSLLEAIQAIDARVKILELEKGFAEGI